MIQKQTIKHYLFPIIGLFVIATALSVSILQISKVTHVSTKASDFTLVPYPGISWSQPKPYTVSFLRESETPDETISYSLGQMVTAESEKNISQEVYFFYNQLLISKEYSLLQVIGDPRKDVTWVATYESDNNICQIQYYPTPYKPNHFTVLLFFGNE